MVLVRRTKLHAWPLVLGCLLLVGLDSPDDARAGWQAGFHVPVLDGRVEANAVFDDGTGPALYVGGMFSAANDVVVSGLARWDGSQWSDVDGGVRHGVELGQVNALAVFDDGTGPALYVGGWFTSAGDVEAPYVAKWDGVHWSA